MKRKQKYIFNGLLMLGRPLLLFNCCIVPPFSHARVARQPLSSLRPTPYLSRCNNYRVRSLGTWRSLSSCSTSTPERPCLFPSSSKLAHDSKRTFFSCSSVWCGIEQLQDVPLSTDRKPRGFHRGPGKRQTSEREVGAYQFMKKWDLEMKEAWDALEPFQGLPKPKKLLGNEAAEIVWPYVFLLERVIRVHPFTKSIYLYYSHPERHTFSKEGKWAAQVARAFSHVFLIPITFHNSHVYVETEMLLECSDTPWMVIHCLDGRHKVFPIRPAPPTESCTPASAAAALLPSVVKVCESLGSTVQHPKEITRLLNERPLQNQYVRVNYQWFGDTPEERASHLVQWEFDPESITPILPRSRSRHIMNWLNYDGNLPTAAAVHINVKREKARMQLPRTTGGPRSFFNAAGSRANSRYSKFGGSISKTG